MATKEDTHVLASALADAHAWLDEIADEMFAPDRRAALHAMRAALHALRDRLDVEQNARLTAQLPTLIRGIYYEAWQPESQTHERDLSVHLARMRAELLPGAPDVDPVEAARAVYGVLRRHVSDGEDRKIAQALPHQLRVLWDPAAVS